MHPCHSLNNPCFRERGTFSCVGERLDGTILEFRQTVTSFQQVYPIMKKQFLLFIVKYLVLVGPIDANISVKTIKRLLSPQSHIIFTKLLLLQLMLHKKTKATSLTSLVGS